MIFCCLVLEWMTNARTKRRMNMLRWSWYYDHRTMILWHGCHAVGRCGLWNREWQKTLAPQGDLPKLHGHRQIFRCWRRCRRMTLHGSVIRSQRCHESDLTPTLPWIADDSAIKKHNFWRTKRTIFWVPIFYHKQITPPYLVTVQWLDGSSKPKQTNKQTIFTNVSPFSYAYVFRLFCNDPL